MDIDTFSFATQQVRSPVPSGHDGLAVARRGRARTKKVIARANIMIGRAKKTVWKVELRSVQLQNLAASLHLLYIFKAVKYVI